MPKVWDVSWTERVIYNSEVVADTEEEALRYFETGGEFFTEPKIIWAEMSSGPFIKLVGGEV